MTPFRRVQRHSRPQKVMRVRRLRKSDAFEILRRSRDAGMPVSERQKIKENKIHATMNTLKYKTQTGVVKRGVGYEVKPTSNLMNSFSYLVYHLVWLCEE